MQDLRCTQCGELNGVQVAVDPCLGCKRPFCSTCVDSTIDFIGLSFPGDHARHGICESCAEWMRRFERAEKIGPAPGHPVNCDPFNCAVCMFETFDRCPLRCENGRQITYSETRWGTKRHDWGLCKFCGGTGMRPAPRKSEAA